MGSSSGSQHWEPPSPAHLAALLPGYEIRRLLGRGGMGAVYEALQSRLDRKVAIKLLPESLGADNGVMRFAERFKLEAKSMAGLDHPGIISVYDFGETREGHLYFVMEFIDGMDIQHYLQRHGGRLPVDRAIAIIAHVLDALDYAHGRGIVHRDIKPANVMINSAGRVKLADFGLVKRLSGEGETGGLTRTDLAFGTPDYVAPETLELRPVDHRADLYGVGVMLYHLLTGALPRGSVKPPSALVPGLDPRLDALLERAMETNPDERFQSAADFRAAIDRLLSTPPPPVDAEGGPPAVPPPADRHRPALLAAIIGLPVLGIIAAIIAVVSGRDAGPDQAAGEAEPAEPPPTVKPAPPAPQPRPQPISLPDASEPAFQPVDLLAHVDLGLSPKLRREEGGGLHCPAYEPVFVTFDPAAVAGDEGYLIDAILTTSQANGFDWEFPISNHRLTLAVDLAEDGAADRSIELGLDQGAGDHPFALTYDTGLKVGLSAAHRLLLEVSPGRIRLEIDGVELIDRSGRIEDIPFDWAPEVGGASARGRITLIHFGPYTLHRLRLLAPGAEPEAVDLAAIVAPQPIVSPTPTPDPDPPVEPIPDAIDTRLAELEAEYRAAFEAPLEEALTTLRSQLLAALEREAKAADDLGEASDAGALRDEARRVAGGADVGADDEAGAPRRLRELRETWHQQLETLRARHEADRRKVVESFNRALVAYREELVRDGDTGGAQRVEARRQKLAGEGGDP